MNGSVVPGDALKSLDDYVVVFAPIGRDAFVVDQTLASAGISCVSADASADLVEHLRAGIGVMLITEESLSPAMAAAILTVLAEQPSWSDLPIVLLLSGDAGLETQHLAALTLARNVTVLERPVPAVTLVTAVQAALRARHRQYEVRDLLVSERAAREQAETAIRAKDEFLATVSHEMRTPLSAILLWSRLLETGRLSGEKAEHAMRAIVTTAQAQSDLIEDLIDVSRMLMGKLRINVGSHSLTPILHAALDVVRPMADAKGIRLDLVLDAVDDVARVDADRVQQIFSNLLTNALKFTASGGSVSVRLGRELDQMIVIVADTGKGIAPELLPHIFERFRQGDHSQAERHGGLGLGLPIVHELVELHGGTIEVASAGTGTGATFTVRLPAAVDGNS